MHIDLPHIAQPSVFDSCFEYARFITLLVSDVIVSPHVLL